MDVFHSPFIIPLGAFAVAIVAIIGGIWSDIQNKRIRAEQRMAMLARGMSSDDIEKALGKVREQELPVKDPLRSLGNARRTAIVLISSGIGLIIFGAALAYVVRDHEVLAVSAAGLIPLCIGIGFFVDYNLQKRELSRFGMEIDQAS